jgi:GDP-D-mannose 3', 5'-epimerase
MKPSKMLVLGAGGFIGSHLVKRLKEEGHWVRGVDLKFPEFSETMADDFIIADLRNQNDVARCFDQRFDTVYQLAADMGGAGYIFTGENDTDVMLNSASININVVEACINRNIQDVFYSSSACMYPEHNQEDPNNPNCLEDSAYPANPDSEYGWEKLFSERLYLAANRNYNKNFKVARFHNIFGPEGTWTGGKEKAPAALCRKVAEAAKSGGLVEVWGDGKQTRSFLYIDECIEAVQRLMNSKFNGPVNIGSDEMITINGLAKLVAEIAQSEVEIINIPGPRGVAGRNSQNDLIQQELDWSPNLPLRDGIAKTYHWISNQISANR